MLLGLVAMVSLAGRGISDDVRRNLGFIVRMEHDVAPEHINTVKKVLAHAPYTAQYVYSSASDIMVEESAALGEDISQLLEVNPYSGEFDVKMKPLYANYDSIISVAAQVETLPGVDEVITESDVIRDVDRSFNRIGLILLLSAGLLLIISFVLINNTVSLSIYSRRFLIHTMRLVGATAGFIRRPFVRAGCVNGFIAGLIACGALAGIRTYAAQYEADAIDASLPWGVMGIVGAIIIVTGILLCALASALATNRQLRRSYDKMFLS